MTTLVTIVISLLAGAAVVTMTAPAWVAILTVCGVAFVSLVLLKALRG